VRTLIRYRLGKVSSYSGMVRKIVYFRRQMAVVRLGPLKNGSLGLIKIILCLSD